eukprot:TRINITY_DN251_c0_g4_i1.p2 TRINITY_DN251_c0_g4~~TRINITY_DN251_c0_g4_i1.p2  ORF type:complete len:100 (-),score=8.54 TRINITY_DN251_c0_g4_i1:44-343(-)
MYPAPRGLLPHVGQDEIEHLRVLIFLQELIQMIHCRTKAKSTVMTLAPTIKAVDILCGMDSRYGTKHWVVIISTFVAGNGGSRIITLIALVTRTETVPT